MKIVNLYAPHQFKVKNIEVKGFVNQVELTSDEIRQLLGAGVKVSEIVDGKEIILSFTNYTQDFKSYETVKVEEKTTPIIESDSVIETEEVVVEEPTVEETSSEDKFRKNKFRK